ncbi:MAG: Ig-like domain-containing protein [Eubacterium sp.]|nr:Ig-like domain-containing protein [Eubacterium sp.]
MIKKSAKKALAFTLAAGMAFSAAPISFPAGPQVAKAAESSQITNITSVSFKLGTNIYNSFKAEGLASMLGASVKAEVENEDVVGLALDASLKYADNADKLNEAAAGNLAGLQEKIGAGKVDTTVWDDEVTVDDKDANINMKAVGAGTTKINLTSTDGSTQAISVTVADKESYFKVLDAEGNEIPEGGSISVVAGGTVTAKLSAENIKTAVDDIGVLTDTTHSGYINSDDGVASVEYKAAIDTFEFTGVSEGTTQMNLYLNEDNKIFSFNVNVIAQTEIYANIGDKLYTFDGAWKCEGVAATPKVFLDGTDRSGKISATSNNGKAATYELKAGSTNIILGNDGSFDAKVADGKVVKGTSTIIIKVPANAETGQGAKQAEVDVIVNEEKAKLVSVEVTSDGEVIGAAAAKVTGVETYAPGNETADEIKLSTKDKPSIGFVVNANVKDSLVTVTPSDEEVVAIEDGKLVAKKAGATTVTVKAAPETEFVDKDATITFPVTVTDKYANNKITVTGEPIVLNAEKLTDTINAKADYNNALTYPTLARKATTSDSKAEQKVGYVDLGTLGTSAEYDVTLNATTGAVTYKNNGKSGTIYVKVEGAANAESEAPEPAYVEVQYGSLKDSELSVAANKLSIKAGESASAGATAPGQNISYSSDDESIAIVSPDGTITGVGAGTAVITVTAEANASYKAASKTVTVVVSAKAKKAVSFKNTSKTYKVKALKKSKKSFSVIKASDGGKVTYKVTKGTKKSISVSKAGKVTVKKGTKKGTYKVKVTVAAKGNYKKTSKTITIKVK